jgi:hypothetical protein
MRRFLSSAKIGFARQKEESCFGTLKYYKRHVFLTNTQQWPREIESIPLVGTMLRFLKDNKDIKVTCCDLPIGDSMSALIFPENVLIPNISQESIAEIAEVIKSLDKDPKLTR